MSARRVDIPNRSLQAGSGELTDAAGKVSAHWDQLASEDFTKSMDQVSWTGIPQIHLNHNYLVTGDRNKYWVTELRERYFPDGNAGDALSLGCGEGHVDRILKDCGFQFRSLTGIDISPAATDRARELGIAANVAPNLTYYAADLNRATLPHASYDFIYFYQSLHHIEALEHVLDECRRALRPSGVLMVNEFVGPSRFQWTARQRRLATALLTLLPEELRRDVRTGKLKTTPHCPTVVAMIAGDPSEAVRSSEIESILKSRFMLLDEWNWGGTLNFLVFGEIAANFKPDDPVHQELIEWLIAYENLMIRQGLLPSDFKMYVAAAPGSGTS
jgi:SAM-dependent methyltransferase